VPKLDHERLRAALEQRAKAWKADLRKESRIARLVLRQQLVGPLTLWDESERPESCRWEAKPTTELLDGLAPTLHVASLAGFVPARVARQRDAARLETARTTNDRSGAREFGVPNASQLEPDHRMAEKS
jgi:hypothetical protein